MGVEFRALGPLEVLLDGEPLRLGGPRQRGLLALLLINANEVVSVDRLVEELWGEEAPTTADNIIQVYVSHLRKALQPQGGTADRLQTKRPGYILRVDDDECDAPRFESLLEDGRASLDAGRPGQAVQELGDALDLWRGQPFADFAYEPFARAEITRLEEARTIALEAHVEARLALGHHTEIVGELRRLVSIYPLREGLRAQLMLALYRSGRQAEALSAYDETRSVMADELGIDPGPALQALQKAMLDQDPSLELQGLAQDRTAPAIEPAEPSEALRDKRRMVTVVACELEARSISGEALDPEIEDRIRGLLLGAAHPIFERHGGTITPAAGDALVAVFGIPLSHEDDTLRAVRAASELPTRIAALAAELERDWKAEVSVRTALCEGEVVSGPEPELGALARPARRALRLLYVAEPGEVVLDDSVYRIVKSEVEVEAISSDAFRLLDVKTALPGRSLRFHSPMVGRTEELELLRQTYARTAEERTCNLLTILGNAGVGKSRLVHEFLSQSPAETVMQGRCLPYGEGITLWPVIEAVTRAAGVTERDDPVLAREKIASLLSGSPDAEPITERVAQAIGLTETSAPPSEIFWGIRKFMEALAGNEPLLVVFDDIHWAEPAFLDLIEHVVESADAPILLLCMARPDLMEQRPNWGEGRANATSLRLEVLDEGDSNTLIDNLLGEVGLDEEVRSRIVTVADGNPLFVEELLSKLVDEGFLRRRGGRWVAAEDVGTVDVPPTIQALLDARLDRLSSGERHALECASIVGQEFSAEAVAHLLPEPLASNANDILISLVRKDLVSPYSVDASGNAIAFRHMLIQDAAYRGIPKMSRATLHERLADWLEKGTAEQTAENQEMVGYHLEQACSYRSELGPADEDHVSLARRAGNSLASSGRRALGRGDPIGAVKLLSRATELLTPGDPERTTVLPDLGEGLVRLGRLEDAESVLIEAIELARESGDQATRWRSVLELCDARFYSDPGVRYKEILGEVDEAMKWFESTSDDLGLARGMWILAGAHYVTGRAGAAEEYLLRAIDHARLAGDPRAVGRFLTSLASALVEGPCPAEDGITRLRNVIPELEDNRLGQSIVFLRLGVFYAMTGDFDEGRSFVVKGRAVLHDLGGTLLGTMVTASEAARVERLAGDPVAAEAHLREGFSELETIGDKAYLPTLAAMLAHVLCSLERWDEAEDVAALSEKGAATGDIVAQILWRGARAKLFAHHNEGERALQLANEATSIGEGTDYLEIKADALMDLAEISRLIGDQPRSVEAAKEALWLYERKGNLVSAERARAAATGPS